MAKNLLQLIINVFLIVLISRPHLLLTQSPGLIRRRDDLNQQIVAKVERINLKDFGIDRQNKREIERQSPLQREIEAPKAGGADSSSGRRQWPYPRADPNVDRTADRFRVDDRLLSRRDGRLGTGRTLNVRAIASPLDWSSSPQMINIGGDSQVTSRRAFNFTPKATVQKLLVNQTKPQIQIKLQTNCTQKCVDTKYLKHYYEKSCKPLLDYECRCPIAFDCPQLSYNTSVCQYEGRTYAVGDRIPVHNPCRICECRDFGRTRGQVMAEIDCGIGIECPEQAFGLKPEPNCYFAYEKDRCCGQQVCPNSTSGSLFTSRADKVCNYKGRQYRRGERIYPDEDSCKICYCDDHWDDARPGDSRSCHLHKCELQLSKDFTTGCLPIYHESTCCPIEYKCPQTVSTSGQSYQSPSDVSQCWFDGRQYPIGARLPSDNACVECQCRTPPDFSCVQRSCPSPPANCYVGKWDSSVCCQHYTCSPSNYIRDESQFRHNFYSSQ